MRVNDIIISDDEIDPEIAKKINISCSQFMEASAGIPLFKLFPIGYNDFCKVKIRYQKPTTTLSSKVFDNAFKDHTGNIRSKAIFAYPNIKNIHENYALYYIFPSNGYKFLYSKEVHNSNDNCKLIIDTLVEQLRSEVIATELVTDVLKYTYLSSNLHEGLESNSEIIIYNIPYYYAVRVNSCSNYNSLLYNQSFTK